MVVTEQWSRAAAAEFADRMSDPRTSYDTGRIHDLVVRTIGGWILGGTFGPGAALPREEEMAGLFSVSRSTIREANKVLSAKGLIELKPRVGVRVRERRSWRLLDAEVISWFPSLADEKTLFENLIEARRIVEPEAAFLSAERATPLELAKIEAAFNQMRATFAAPTEAWCEADLSFHRAVLAASHNFVLQALGDTLEAAFRSAVLATARLRDNQTDVLDLHLDVMECIRHRDAPGARSAMLRLLATAATHLDLTVDQTP